MEWDETAALRARMDAAGMELAVAPAGGVACGAGWLLAEVGGPTRSVRWAVTDQSLLVPGPAWGDSLAAEVGVARCVRTTEDAPLSELTLRKPRAAELEKPRPGVYQEVVFRGQLDGDVAQVARKFWSVLEAATPGLAERVSGDVPLESVTYEDRFVVSPLNATVAHRVLSALTRHPGGIVRTTKVAVRTTSSPSTQATAPRQGTQLHADWVDATEQAAVLESLFVDVGASTVTVHPRRGSPHFRQLVLRWIDGRTLIVRLDRGLSFLRPQAYMPWRFGDPAPRQAAALGSLSCLVRQEMGTVVPIYVSGPA
jgi:hypothetical protein